MRQAASWPDRIAVVFEDRRVTYKALDERSNRLAHLLRRRGVGREALVAICLDRSEDLVAAILGVLKAGGAYVPLDPTHSDERIAFYLSDTGAPLVISSSAVGRRWPPGVGVVLLDADAAALAAEAAHPPDAPGAPDDLAYVTYTSGSTGTPKGVMTTHHNAARFLRWTQAWFGFGEHDVFTMFHSYTWDTSAWEMWGALLHGGRLVVVPYDHCRALHRFARLLREQRVTVLCQTPSVFRQLMPIILDAPAEYALRYLAFTGEALSFAALRPWMDRFGDARPRIVNMYGPTETTVFASYRAVTRADVEAPPGSMIGAPLPDLEFLVLDANLDPVPEGEAGELFIAGEGLARGYFRRPELTAERYPSWHRDGRRLYRTGDLVRRTPDGDTEYLGRADEQVKIRGHRVEPGEVAAHLARHPDVADAAVIALGEPGERRLVAYIVSRAGHAIGARDLLGFLTRRLPDYMVPSAIVFLGRLPLNANGKLDRRALPPPRAEASAFRAPETRAQHTLARLFAEAIGVPAVGLDDGFLALGGHSLCGARILWGVQRELGVDLPFRALIEARTLEELAERVERTAPRAGAALTPPAPSPRGAPLPLSPAQMQFWVQQRRAPDAPAYNETIAVDVLAPLDAGALRGALRRLVRRHEVLRCVFVEVDGRPFKRVLDDAEVELLALDLEAIPPSERMAEARRRATEEARRPFDLRAGPLLRVTLARFGEAEHRVFVTFHHIIMDGMAANLFFTELEEEYFALTAGGDVPISPLPAQEPEYCAWQLASLEAARPTLLGWWRERLAGLPELTLLADRPRPTAPTLRGESALWPVPRALAQRAHAAASSTGVTRFTLMLAAFVAFLHRRAGGDEVVLGTFTGGRNLPGSEAILGCFVNALVLRVPIVKQEPFKDLLVRVRDITMDAYAHQELPFHELVAELQPPREPGKNPLFQIAFAADPPPAPGRYGWQLRPAEIDRGTSQIDLTFQVVERSDTLSLFVEHSTELFDAKAVARMVESYLALLDGAIAALQEADAGSPAATIASLPLLTSAERGEIMRIAGADAPYPSGECLHHLIEAQAARTPDAAALVFEGERMSYGQLDAASNQMAHALRALGVGPEARVGLCMERSFAAVVGLLGILKAGGAYVPLDPAYPRTRLSYMLEDAGVSVLLTDGPSLGALPEHGARLLLVDQDREAIDAQPMSRPDVDVGPDGLAYVIYTSGSTGRPKGALVPHRGLCSLAPALIDAFGIRAEHRILQFSSLSFDASMMEILMALPAGAALVLAPRRTLLPGLPLRRVIRDQRVTVALLSPSTLAALTGDGESSDPGALPLEIIIAGGEPCPAHLVAQVATGRRFFNAYGPTEATICATVTECLADGQRPPIGQPLPNVRCYVLDERLEPVPIGVPGELYLGGVGVGRGYLGRPGLTAERFIPDPLGGGRLYRTGDLARWREDGRLEHLGRVDHQIKLRGFRVEPGEIEAELGRHPHVHAASVSAVELGAGDRHLVAHVAPRPGAPADLADTLKRFLRDRLPDHMVPSAVVLVGSMPIGPNGKIDRARLPLPEAPRADRAGTFAPPRTELEHMIAGIWRDSLHVEHVGVHDNFFDLGGHSLRMSEVHARLERALGRQVPVITLFQHPTVSALAEHFSRSGAAPSAPAVQQATREALARAEKARAAIEQARSQAAGRRRSHG